MQTDANIHYSGLPRWLSGKESAKGDAVPSLSQQICWRRKWPPTPVLLPGKSHGQKGLVGFNVS